MPLSSSSAPLVLGGSQYRTAFNVQQLQAMGQMFLDLNVQANYIALVFFGVFDLLTGYLIVRSTFLPRVLGVLMAIAGLLRLIFLFPPFANHLLVLIEAAAFIAELLLMLWLLVRGVNVQRRNEMAAA